MFEQAHLIDFLPLQSLRKMAQHMAYLAARVENLLSRTQSGFRKSRSTLDNVVTLEQRIRKGWSELKKTYAVFLDMKKAFNMVWIPGLLNKLA
jgi:hypothetical protein